MTSLALGKYRPRIVFTLSAAYLGACFYILFLLPRRFDPSSWAIDAGVRLVPFAEKLAEISRISSWSLRRWNLFAQDTIGNVVLFIPLPWTLSVLFGVKSGQRMLLASVLASVAAEALQHWLRLGVADVDDVIFNTIGAALGILAFRVYCVLKWHQSGVNPNVHEKTCQVDWKA